MSNKREISYGVIPYRAGASGIELCMVHQVSGDHWSFPKGHREEGESIEETVRRELYEETGIAEIHLVPDAVFTESYQYERNGTLIDKCVEHCLGEVMAETTIPYPTDEIIEARWGTIEELSQLPLFQQRRAVLDEVGKWLEDHPHKRTNTN